ncbi:MAG: ABC transporter permease [Thermotogota bacterium]
MKLWNSYLKEMKIAGRGFYFYIEILVALVMVFVLLVLVNETPVSRQKEIMYYDMTPFMFNIMTNKEISEGKLRISEGKTFTLKPMEFQLIEEDSGKKQRYTYDEKMEISVKTMETLDPKTGEVVKTAYITESEEDMFRLAHQEKQLGVTVGMNEKGQFSFKYYLQGYETERLVNLLYVVHNEKSTILQAQMNRQQVRELETSQTLNNRENMVPLFITFAGTLMGFFIVMAYIFLDKDEGVIKAYAVTPSSVGTYLLSKTGVILTTVLISTSIITIPVMGMKPNYPLMYLFLLVTTFTFAELGLLVASFYDSFDKAFGALYLVMIVLMVPAFSYLIPSFDPIYLRFFPTYPILQGFKDILLNVKDMSYVLSSSLVFLIAGLLLFWAAQRRLSKTLSV